MIHCAKALAFAGMVALAAGQALHAQTAARSASIDPRWYPWLGCWQSESEQGGSASLTCVVPASSGSGVDALTIANATIASRERLDATGKPRPVEKDGCRGTETADWASTNRRVYFRADYTCGAALKGTTTTLLGISASGDWLEVAEVRAGGGSIERVIRRRDAGLPASLPKEIVTALSRRQLAISTARAAAAAPVGTDDIVEATRELNPTVVRSWLAERGQRIDFNANQVAALNAAGVSTAVLAPMTAPQPGMPVMPYDSSRMADAYLRGRADAMAQTQAYGCPTGACNASTMYSPYNGYGYSPYAAYPYGYAPGFGVYSPFVLASPIIGVRGGVIRGPIRGHPVFRPPVGRHR